MKLRSDERRWPDPGLAKDDGTALRAAGDTPILLGAMCNGLGQLVTEVRARAANKSIAALRLDGHGNLGRWMTISVGEVVDLAKENPRQYRQIEKEYFSYINPTHFAKVAPLLGQLARRFAPFGFAEHHGCSLGKRPETRKMMARLADLWGVPVSVGVTLQPFGVVTYFAGPVVTVFPGRQEPAHVVAPVPERFAAEHEISLTTNTGSEPVWTVDGRATDNRAAAGQD